MRGCAKGGVVSGLIALSFLWLFASPAKGQVFTVTPEKIQQHYLDFRPTTVSLPYRPLSMHGRQQLLRFLQSEQGFAMRPLPVSTLSLVANGGMKPGGMEYVQTLNQKGISVRPGDRVMITNVKIVGNRITLDLNDGPEHKHRFLRHISVGTDPYYTTPIVQDSDAPPTGSRVVLLFPGGIPDVTGKEVEALLHPLIGFEVKSRVEAFTDTLPPAVRNAILNHQVLVGMSTEMVLFALGQPERKVREMDGQMPFEEWIYGEVPEAVQFIRINGNRVIRVEVATVGKPPVIRAENEMGDYWQVTPDPDVRQIKLGDTNPASIAQEDAPRSAPSLRNPGEKLPGDDDKNRPVMGPVQFPKDSGQQPQTAPAASPSAPAPASAPPPSQPAPQSQYESSDPARP